VTSDAVPAGQGNLQITGNTLTAGNVIPQPPADTEVLQAFELHVFDAAGKEVKVQFAQDVEVRAPFLQQDVVRAGGDVNRLRLARFDGANWEIKSTSVDTTNNRLVAKTRELSPWAIMVVPAAKGVSTVLIVVIVIVAVAVVGIAGFFVLRRRRT